MPYDGIFNANEVEPRQGGGKHQVGNKWPGTITATRVDETKDKKGGMFVVTFTSAGGSVDHRYNLWNESEQARNISKQQLSALCHATGIFQVDFKNDGAALRGAKVLYDVGFQAGQEPSAENPAGGYVELKKVYDLQGNDTWNSGGAQQQTSGFVPPDNRQTQQMQPNNQQNNAGGQSMQGGWNNGGQQQQQQSQPQNNQGGGWNTQQQQQPDNNQQQGGWNNAGGQQQTPPWKT